jgi:hypothetical protein
LSHHYQLVEVSTLGVTAIMLRFDFALSCNDFIFSRIVYASISYCSEHTGAMIASYSYRSDIIDQHNASVRYRFWGKIAFKKI